MNFYIKKFLLFFFNAAKNNFKKQNLTLTEFALHHNPYLKEGICNSPKIVSLKRKNHQGIKKIE
jgi:hypothetical protein